MGLFNIPILTTALSVAICWAMFAIFCSMLHEAISQMKGERGRFMKKWLLRQLLDRPNGLNWASMLYMHGSIDLLTRTPSQPTGDIEARLFAETLIEVVGNAQVVQMNKSTVVSHLTYKSEILNNFKAATLLLKQSDVVSFYQKAIHSAELCAHPNGQPDESEIYKCLVSQIQHWYLELCERLSYWYKKRTKVRLFILGVFIAIVLNVDSVQIFKHFETTPASKEIVMNFYEANADRLTTLANQSTDSLSYDSIQRQVFTYSRLMDSVVKMTVLPIGWNHSILNDSIYSSHPKFSQCLCRNCIIISKKDGWFKNVKSRFSNFGVSLKTFFCKLWVFFWFILLPKVPGLIISGLAASFGAPFWFDLIKKVYSRKNPVENNAVS